MMTCCVRDLKRTRPDWEIYVNTNYPAIWENNPHIAGVGEALHPDVSLDIGPHTATQGSKTNGLHFAAAFRVCLESKLDIQIQQGHLWPELFLTGKFRR